MPQWTFFSAGKCCKFHVQTRKNASPRGLWKCPRAHQNCRSYHSQKYTIARKIMNRSSLLQCVISILSRCWFRNESYFTIIVHATNRVSVVESLPISLHQLSPHQWDAEFLHIDSSKLLKCQLAYLLRFSSNYVDPVSYLSTNWYEVNRFQRAVLLFQGSVLLYPTLRAMCESVTSSLKRKFVQTLHLTFCHFPLASLMESYLLASTTDH